MNDGPGVEPNVLLVDGPYDGKQIRLPIGERLSSGHIFTARNAVIGTPEQTGMAEYCSYHREPAVDGLYRFHFDHMLTPIEIERLGKPPGCDGAG